MNGLCVFKISEDSQYTVVYTSGAIRDYKVYYGYGTENEEDVTATMKNDALTSMFLEAVRTRKEILLTGQEYTLETDDGTVVQRFPIAVKELAAKNFYESNYDTDICFEHKGQSIINPWYDTSGRFPLTDVDAIYEYGAENMIAFCKKALAYLFKEDGLSMID